VGFGALAVTLSAAACFAGAATGGLPTISGAGCCELVSATGAEFESVACGEPDSLEVFDGSEGVLPPSFGTVSCGVVSVGVDSVGVVSVGVVSVGVVSSPLQ
jgi:hypothetical protein